MEWKGAREWAIERDSVRNKRKYVARWGYELEIVDMSTKNGMRMNGEKAGKRWTVSGTASGNTLKPNGKLFLSLWVFERG